MQRKRINRLREIIEKPLKYIGSKIPAKIKHMATAFIKRNANEGFINYGYNVGSVVKKLNQQRNYVTKTQKRVGKFFIIRKSTFVVIPSVLEVLKSLIIKFSGKTNMRFSKFRPQAFYKVGNLRIHYVINV